LIDAQMMLKNQMGDVAWCPLLKPFVRPRKSLLSHSPATLGMAAGLIDHIDTPP
jgi:hypothetical protein